MFVLPDGRVFDAGPDPPTHLLDVSGNGTMSNGPVSPFDGSSAVMYAPGKVMKSGTWSDPSFAGRTVTGRTAVIDMNQPSPVWRETAPMHHPRSFETITSLPDGTSIVTGGTSRSDGVDMATAVLPAEIWNPETETWTEMAAQVNGRGYHSTALLLPDGRVLSAGGGQLPGYPVVDQRNAEIFSPPYLFKGPRPTVLSAPSTVQHGSTFTVGVAAPESIAKVSLVRLGSQTHTFDQNQRYIPLNFTNTGASLSVQAPANSSIAPPGYYMLFVLNGNGVPSMAEFVRMPAPNEDATAPTAPANLTATGGLGKVDLTWSASTDNGSIRRYNVHRSTTPGFTPTAANRVGQPTGTSFTDSGLAGGTYHYMVQAEDQAGNLSTPSAEASATATGDSTAPTVSITAPADGATVQASVNVTANAADAVGVSGVQFKLDGANLGAEDTSAPYSVAWDTTAAANGAHSLSAVARDAAGNTRTATTVSVTVANTGPPPGAPVAAYGFDEASGTTVSDASGRNNTGSITGAVRTTATAKYGGAITFDGVNDLITVPDANSLDLTNGMTLEAWVRPTASRQLPHRDHQGDDRQPRLRAVLELDGVREQQRAAPVGVDLLQRHRRHGGAAAERLGAPRLHLRRRHLALLSQRRPGRAAGLHGCDPRLQRRAAHRREQHLGRVVRGSARRGPGLRARPDAARGRARPRHADRRAAPGRHHQPDRVGDRACGRRDGGRDGQRDRERLGRHRGERRAVQARRRQPRRRGHQRAVLRRVGHARGDQRRAMRSPRSPATPPATPGPRPPSTSSSPTTRPLRPCRPAPRRRAPRSRPRSASPRTPRTTSASPASSSSSTASTSAARTPPRPTRSPGTRRPPPTAPTR